MESLCDTCHRREAESFTLQGSTAAKACRLCLPPTAKTFPLAAMELFVAAQCDQYYFAHLLDMNDKFLKFLQDLLTLAQKETEQLLRYIEGSLRARSLAPTRERAKERLTRTTAKLSAAIRSVSTFSCWRAPMSPLTHSILNSDDAGDYQLVAHVILFPSMALEVVQEEGLTTWQIGARLSKALMALAWRHRSEVLSHFASCAQNAHDEAVVKWTQELVDKELLRHEPKQGEEPFLVLSSPLDALPPDPLLASALAESWDRASKVLLARTVFAHLVSVENLHYNEAIEELSRLMETASLFLPDQSELCSSLAVKMLRLCRWKAKLNPDAPRASLRAFALLRRVRSAPETESLEDLAGIAKSLQQRPEEEALVVRTMRGTPANSYSVIAKVRDLYR